MYDQYLITKELVDTGFNIDDNNIETFKKQGFLHLKKLFSPDIINYLQKKIDEDIASPVDKYQSGFNRVAFDLFTNDQVIDRLMLSNSFRGIMKRLTGKSLLYTQGLGFELKKNESKGFPWHIGTQSFGYQRAEDFGCTIWTPLVPIKSSGQRGGMAYVPKNIVSGEFMYTHVDPAVFNSLQERIDKEDEVTVNEFIHLRDGPLNDPAMRKILDFFSVEDDFELGDALIFDKNVIHKSIMLEEGKIESRAAFVMRFVCSDSKYDLKRAMDLEIPRKHFGYAGPTSFHLDVCNDNDEYIVNSKLFEKNKEKYLLV